MQGLEIQIKINPYTVLITFALISAAEENTFHGYP